MDEGKRRGTGARQLKLHLRELRGSSATSARRGPVTSCLRIRSGGQCRCATRPNEHTARTAAGQPARLRCQHPPRASPRRRISTRNHAGQRRPPRPPPRAPRRGSHAHAAGHPRRWRAEGPGRLCRPSRRNPTAPLTTQSWPPSSASSGWMMPRRTDAPPCPQCAQPASPTGAAAVILARASNLQRRHSKSAPARRSQSAPAPQTTRAPDTPRSALRTFARLSRAPADTRYAARLARARP